MSKENDSQRNNTILGLVVALLIISVFIIWQLKKTNQVSLTTLKNVPVERINGSNNATVKIVGFVDFSCEKCARGADLIKKISSEHPTEISFAFKYFPLKDINSGVSAYYADCVAQQNKFWKYHDQLFAQLNQWKDQVNVDPWMLIIAKTIDVDISQLSMCLEKGNAEYALKADKNESKALGIKTAPTYFVNGQLIGDEADLAKYFESYYKK